MAKLDGLSIVRGQHLIVACLSLTAVVFLHSCGGDKPKTPSGPSGAPDPMNEEVFEGVVAGESFRFVNSRGEHNSFYVFLEEHEDDVHLDVFGQNPDVTSGIYYVKSELRVVLEPRGLGGVIECDLVGDSVLRVAPDLLGGSASLELYARDREQNTIEGRYSLERDGLTATVHFRGPYSIAGEPLRGQHSLRRR